MWRLMANQRLSYNDTGRRALTSSYPHFPKNIFLRVNFLERFPHVRRRGATLSVSSLPQFVNDPEPAVSLETLFTESAPDLSLYFQRRHASGIDDLVQETFLQMARFIDRGNHVTCMRGYLFGIARRLSQSAWTQNQREKLQPLDSDAGEISAPIADDRIAAARETIAALPDLQREILDLRFSLNLSYAEIAEALHIPIGTVRSRLHSAISVVRQRLETD